MTMTKTPMPIGHIRKVIVHYNCQKFYNGWLKYDHRLMYKKYTTRVYPLPSHGMWGSRKTREMAQPTKKEKSYSSVDRMSFLRIRGQWAHQVYGLSKFESRCNGLAYVHSAFRPFTSRLSYSSRHRHYRHQRKLIN